MLKTLFKIYSNVNKQKTINKKIVNNKIKYYIKQELNKKNIKKTFILLNYIPTSKSIFIKNRKKNFIKKYFYLPFYNSFIISKKRIVFSFNKFFTCKSKKDFLDEIIFYKKSPFLIDNKKFYPKIKNNLNRKIINISKNNNFSKEKIIEFIENFFTKIIKNIENIFSIYRREEHKINNKIIEFKNKIDEINDLRKIKILNFNIKIFESEKIKLYKKIFCHFDIFNYNFINDKGKYFLNNNIVDILISSTKFNFISKDEQQIIDNNLIRHEIYNILKNKKLNIENYDYFRNLYCEIYFKLILLINDKRRIIINRHRNAFLQRYGENYKSVKNKLMIRYEKEELEEKKDEEEFLKWAHNIIIDELNKQNFTIIFNYERNLKLLKNLKKEIKNDPFKSLFFKPLEIDFIFPNKICVFCGKYENISSKNPTDKYLDNLSKITKKNIEELCDKNCRSKILLFSYHIFC